MNVGYARIVVEIMLDEVGLNVMNKVRILLISTTGPFELKGYVLRCLRVDRRLPVNFTPLPHINNSNIHVAIDVGRPSETMIRVLSLWVLDVLHHPRD